MEDELSSKAKLRIEFIGMAFALAVGQVGLEIGEFYSHDFSLYEHPYVLSQLLLGTYVIAASWVGWQKSKSLGHLREIDSTFGKGFIILFVDLFLVICYFILIRSVEKPYEARIASISAKPELFWSLVIFFTYAIWDFLTKAFDFDSSAFKVSWHPKIYFARSYQAFVCIFLIFIIEFFGMDSMNKNVVVITDIYLLLVFILFRGLKEEIKGQLKHPKIIFMKYIVYRVVPILCIVAILANLKFGIISI